MMEKTSTTQPKLMITAEELELHAKWLRKEPGGKRLVKVGANLVGANLAGAIFVEASLSGANLAKADLLGGRLERGQRSASWLAQRVW